MLLAINAGNLRPVAGVKNLSGIAKSPVTGPVRVHAQGLEGDHIGNKRYHGGPDQALYLYSAADYRWWEGELQRSLPFGTFGENLTVTDLGSARVGDVWHLGDVTLQLTAPRIPCGTLAAHMGDPAFAKKFATANRGGAYARVLSAGILETGMAITIVPAPTEHPAIDDLFALWHRPDKDTDLLRRALASPVASRFREVAERWLNDRHGQ